MAKRIKIEVSLTVSLTEAQLRVLGDEMRRLGKTRDQVIGSLIMTRWQIRRKSAPAEERLRAALARRGDGEAG